MIRKWQTGYRRKLFERQLVDVPDALLVAYSIFLLRNRGFRLGRSMANITIQVVEGFERGRVFADLPAPLTIGREEDNTIQLNDERVSRFHIKIQEDGGRFILTDLESTNGTKINGHPVQMRVLQPGDQVAIGRTLLLVGSESEIRNSIQASFSEPPKRRLSPEDPKEVQRTYAELPDSQESEKLASVRPQEQAQDRIQLFPSGPPSIPAGLRISQAAQLTDLLSYIHEQIGAISEAAVEDRRAYDQDMRVDRITWQRLLRLQMQLAKYMRQITEP